MSDKKQARNLRQLRGLYRKLDKKGGPEADGELFEEIAGLEEETLALSGLPPTASNTAMLNKLREYDATSTAVGYVQSLLHIAKAEAARENRAPLELLARGIANRESPYDVLPQMGLITHEYTLYLYDLLLGQPTAIVEIYNEMMRPRELLEPISLLKQSYEELKGMNVRFLERFLQPELPGEQEPTHTAEPIQENAGGYVAQVTHVVQTDEPQEYSVRLVVNSKEEVDLLREAVEEGAERPVVHAYVYDMTVTVSEEGNSMAPDNDLAACMEVFHEHGYDDNLNPALRRKWKTAYLADAIAARLISSGLLDLWDSEEAG